MANDAWVRSVGAKELSVVHLFFPPHSCWAQLDKDWFEQSITIYYLCNVDNLDLIYLKYS